MKIFLQFENLFQGVKKFFKTKKLCALLLFLFHVLVSFSFLYDIHNLFRKNGAMFFIVYLHKNEEIPFTKNACHGIIYNEHDFFVPPRHLRLGGVKERKDS